MRIGLFSVVDHYPAEIERTAGQFFSELLEQAELADQLGFDSFWIAEHHFHEYGAIPRPAIWMAAAAQRTKRIRLGAAVAVLPFDNPLRAAEDYAMVDILSNGRLSLGVGSGYLQHEFAGFGIAPEEKRERFDESLSVMLQAWRGEKFSYCGKFYEIKDVALNVTPVQKPIPPTYIAVLRNEAAQFVGQQGFSLLMIPYASTEKVEELSGVIEGYKAALARGESRNATGQSTGFGLHAYCAEDTEQAREYARPYMDRYVRTRLYAKQRPFELLVERDLLAVGSPDEVTRVAKRYQSQGMTEFLAIMNFGGLPHDKVLSSMRLMARSVLPSFTPAAG